MTINMNGHVNLVNGSASAPAATGVVVGVLALQGAFAEHQHMLSKLSNKCNNQRIKSILVRTCEDLQSCDGLIIPGGESTTIALLAKLSGLLDLLREFVKTKPVWGTCAGAILLSQQAIGTKKGGQELLGGIDVCIERNGWGTQVESFEVGLNVEGLRDPHRPFTGVFIRAPVIISFLPSSTSTASPIEILSRLPPDVLPPAPTSVSATSSPMTDVVALRQGRHLLTTFHPELTNDDRFHEYFVRQCVLPSLSG